MIGSPENESGHYSDERQQKVEIPKDFWVASAPITNEQYLQYDSNHNSGHYKKTNLNIGDYPVVNVSWDNALKYCTWLANMIGVTVKLPDEIQWEYFCRAGTTESRYWGEEIEVDYCRYSRKKILSFGLWKLKNKVLCSTTAGSYKPNPWGIYDTIGNIWEWCNNWYSIDVKDKIKVENLKPARGGSWASATHFCRAAARVKYPPHYRNQELGFRVVIV